MITLALLPPPLNFLSNFLDNLDHLYEQADSDTQQWAAFLHAWYATYGEREVLAADVVRDLKAGAADGTALGAELSNALPDELSDLYKGEFRRRLGKALAAHVGSRFDDSGLHIERGGTQTRNGAIYWKVTGLRVLRVSNLTESGLITSYPPREPLGGEGRGDSAEKIADEATGNIPAKPANPHVESGGGT